MILLTVTIRHERRLRIAFSKPLAIGAFDASLYTIVNLDGINVAPTVVAAMLIPSSPSVVELALGGDLVSGSLYKVTAVGVPAQDASVTPAGTEQKFRHTQRAKVETRERPVTDRERALYGIDIIWNGTDYQETATGDLARVAGPANVTKALWRGVYSNGLPWDRNWGGKVRQFVDSPSSSSTTLRGAVLSYVLGDPRVSRAKTELQIDDANTYLHIIPTLTTGESAERVSVTVPNDA